MILVFKELSIYEKEWVKVWDSIHRDNTYKDWSILLEMSG